MVNDPQGESAPSSGQRDASEPAVAVERGLIAIVLVAAFAWAYFPTLVGLVHTWSVEPDYSHGFLVLPLALYFLWVRRQRFPGLATSPAWGGVALLAGVGAAQVLGGWVYFSWLGAWLIPLWVGGVCWFLGGRPFLRWCLPSLVFLWFMAPLPFRFEQLLSWPLQRFATIASCWVLQSVGQPAVAEGNVIYVNETVLEVAQACSGLRMFVAFFALSTAFAIVSQCRPWQKVLVLLSAPPIAIISNVARVTVTGLLYNGFGSEAARVFTHDVAGWAMIPFAVALLALEMWYVNRLFVEVEDIDPRELMRQRSRVPAH
jgi:exosortase